MTLALFIQPRRLITSGSEPPCTRSLLVVMALVWGLTINALHAETSPTTRWLWVPGTQSGEGCDQLIREVHQSFIKRTSELMPVEIILDGQSLPCKDKRCLKARSVAVGAQVGLLSKVTCTPKSLSVELMVLPVDRPPLTYRSGLSRVSEQLKAKETGSARRGVRGGAPLSPHLTGAQRVGMKLAHAVTLGPKPKPTPAPPKTTKVGAWVSLNVETATQPELFGGAVHIELIKKSVQSQTEWFGTVGISTAQSRYSAQRRYMGVLGGRHRLSRGRLSPLLGGAFILSHLYSKRRVDTLVPVEFDEVSSFEVIREESTLKEERGLEVRPALDAGFVWSGRSVDILLISRLAPLSVAPLDTKSGTWSMMLGARW